MYKIEVQVAHHSGTEHCNAFGIDQLDCIWIDAEPTNEFGADFALMVPRGGIFRIIARVVNL